MALERRAESPAGNVMKTGIIVALILNLLLFAAGLYGCVYELFKHGTGALVFYTFDSNVLGVLASGIMSVFLIRTLITGAPIPQWCSILKYSAACCLMVTFLVVVFVLAPSMKNGYKLCLFTGNEFIQHLICPLLCVFTVIFTDPVLPGNMSITLFALGATALYALVTFILNLTRTIVGPYPFLHVYEQSVGATVFWGIAIIGGSWVISFLIRLAAVKLPYFTVI